MSARFVVTEIEGFRIGGTWQSSSGGLGLSVSVIDTAYCCSEVARFDSESQRGHAGRAGGCPREVAFERIRNRARGLAAMLEAEHAL